MSRRSQSPSLMVQTPAPPLTLTHFLTLPETKPASELIDGKIIQKPMPQGEHSTIQTELATAINSYLKPPRIARAYTELRCSFGERSVVPDVAVFQFGRIPRNADGTVANIFSLAPDWTIEILSPDQSQTKVMKNILYSLAHGTEMGWLIDPKDRSVVIYLPEQSPIVQDIATVELPVPAFATGFQLTLEALFNWLME
jgi:Uma2 family endonuclease